MKSLLDVRDFLSKWEKEIKEIEGSGIFESDEPLSDCLIKFDCYVSAIGVGYPTQVVSIIICSQMGLYFHSDYGTACIDKYKDMDISHANLLAIKQEMEKAYRVWYYGNNKKIAKESKPKESTDYLYLIVDINNNTLKIGRSKNPKKRIQQLQVATSNPLSLLYKIEKAGYMEEEAHDRFSNLRLASEWFSYDQSIIDYFTQLTAQ